MGQYNSYKDSGFDWIGKIPSHWGLLKSKYLWRESFSVSQTGKEDLLSVSQYDGIMPASGSRSESLVGYKVVEENDLVINIMLAWMGGLGVSRYNGLVSPAYCVYRLQGENNPRYMHYLYKTPMYLAEFARHSTGVIPSRWRMYTDDFGQVLTLIPPREEQDAMVAYLDTTTSKIDEAIAQQQRMIDLLNERKRIMVSTVLTKGLDSKSSLKASGIDYLGEIPSHWNVLALKYIGKVEKAIIDPKELKGKMVYEYSMPAFDEGRKPQYVPAENLDSSRLLISGPTLLINKLNVHKERIWYISNPQEISVASGEFVPVNIYIDDPLFIQYSLLNYRVTDYLINNSNGATNSQKRVSPDVIRSLKLPIPPLDEQKSIVAYLDKVFSPIDEMIASYESMKDYLLERKQIIINDVVTGKVKVV